MARDIGPEAAAKRSVTRNIANIEAASQAAQSEIKPVPVYPRVIIASSTVGENGEIRPISAAPNRTTNDWADWRRVTEDPAGSGNYRFMTLEERWNSRAGLDLERARRPDPWPPEGYRRVPNSDGVLQDFVLQDGVIVAKPVRGTATVETVPRNADEDGQDDTGIGKLNVTRNPYDISVEQAADQPRPAAVDLSEAFQNSNALDEFDVPACIWTLYMVEENAFTDGASQSEIDQAAYYDRLRLTDSEYNKVILASSGRTDEYAISNVDFESVFGTLPGISTNIRFDILVPYGTQLLDVLIQGAQALGISHYGKVPFMLEMRVIGREPGEQRDSPNAGVSTSAGGPAKISKLFAIHIIKMDSSLDAGGMRFHVSAVNYNDLHRHDVYNKLNAQMTVHGGTPRQMLDGLMRGIRRNEEKAVERESVRSVQDVYGWEPVGDPFIDAILDAPFSEFEMTGPTRSVIASSTVDAETFPSVTYDAGTRVTDIIEEIVLNSSKLKAIAAEMQQHNRRVEAEGDEAAQPKRILKEFFNFEADVRPVAFDAKRDDYAKRITYRISRHETPFGLVSRTDLPKRPQHDKDAAIDLAQRHMILKYYEFMYMGRNDQILDLQYQFDNMFYVAIGDIRDEVSSASTDHSVTSPLSNAGIRANTASAQNRLAGEAAPTAAEQAGIVPALDLVGTGGGDAGGLGGPLAGVVDSAVGSATAAMGGLAERVFDAAKETIGAGVDAAVGSIPGGLISPDDVDGIKQRIGDYADNMADHLRPAVAGITDGIGGVTGPAVESIGGALSGAGAVAADMLGNAGGEIADAARNLLVNPATNILGTVGEGLQTGLRGVAGAVGAGITSLADLQRHIRDSVAEQMDSGEESLLDSAGRALRKAGSNIVGGLSGAGNVLGDVAADVGGGIGSLAGGVSDLFGDVSIPFPPTATDLFSKFNFNAKALLPKNSALSGLAKKANQITGGALDSLDFGFDGIEDLDDAVDRGKEFVFDSITADPQSPIHSNPDYRSAEQTPWILYAGDQRLPDAAKYTRPSVEQTENRPTKGIENDGSPGGALLHRYFNAARTSRKPHAVADMVAVQMQIKFDPFYMPDLDARLTAVEERPISIARPLLIMVTSRTPSEYDEETGLMRLTNKNALNGLYMVVAATHRFGEDGMATTALEMKRLLNVDVHNFNIMTEKVQEQVRDAVDAGFNRTGGALSLDQIASGALASFTGRGVNDALGLGGIADAAPAAIDGDGIDVPRTVGDIPFINLTQTDFNQPIVEKIKKNLGF